MSVSARAKGKRGGAQSFLLDEGPYSVGTTGANAGCSFNNDRTVDEIDTSIPTQAGSWLLAAGDVSEYEIRATLNSGTLSGGNTGVWESLTISRTWLTTGTASLTFELRRIARPGDLVTSSGNFTANIGV